MFFRRLNQKGALPLVSALLLVFLLAVAVVIVRQVHNQQQIQSKAQSAGVTLSLQPASETVGEDTQFTVQVRENSNSTLVNAVEADLTYPASQLDFVRVDDTGTAFSLSVQETGGNGSISIVKGTTTPVSGDQLVATIVFSSKEVGGDANVAFANTSAVSDSTTHTNDLTGTTGGTYTVSVPTAAPTATPTPTAVPTPVPTPIPTPVPTATPAPTDVPTAAPTATPTPTAVPTPTPTQTPSPTITPFCGDGICSVDESCSICSQDCGACPGSSNPPANNNSSGGGSSSGGGGGGAPVCTDTAPTSAPNLFEIDTTSNQAVLHFAPAGNPVSSYTVAYGYTAGDNRFGATVSQGSSTGALIYVINSLTPNTTYFFQLRAGNGCASGAWSQSVSAKTSGTPAPAPAPKTYTSYNYTKSKTAPVVTNVVGTPPVAQANKVISATNAITPAANYTPIPIPSFAPNSGGQNQQSSGGFFNGIANFFINIITTVKNAIHPGG